jgi:signal transduction histidine kinase
VVRGALHQEEISSRIRVEEHYAELPSLELDPDQLEAATRRLLRNAVEAMPDGGTLAVSVYRSSSRERMDGAASEHAVIAIADTGCGVPAALGPRIFEPFVTTKPRARGLGLPVARVLVENQGGRLERGPAAMGACFELRFPLLELP